MYICFNSNMVRLAGSMARHVTLYREFQFQYGAISRSDDKAFLYDDVSTFQFQYGAICSLKYQVQI